MRKRKSEMEEENKEMKKPKSEVVQVTAPAAAALDAVFPVEEEEGVEDQSKCI